MTLTGIAEMTLEAHDLGVMSDFYVRAFEVDVLSRDDDRVWLKVGERSRLGLWTPGRKEFGDEGGDHVHYALSATPGTLDSLCDRVRGMGVEVHGPEEHPGGDRSIYFRDPEGNVVEVWDFLERGEGAREGMDALK